jgi:hypothetical protein
MRSAFLRLVPPNFCTTRRNEESPRARNAARET